MATAMVMVTATRTTGEDNNDNGEVNDNGKDDNGGGGSNPAQLTAIN